MKMKLQLLDNNFYPLTAQQAKYLSIETRLPRDGYEIRANPEKVKSLELYDKDRKATSMPTEGWILKTPLRYWSGKTVEKGWVWAVRISFNERHIR